MLNDRVIPFYEEYGIRLLRILTDRGTEYCGAREYYEYQLYLAMEDIDHSKTKARSSQTNGICERFNRIIRMSFTRSLFRKIFYNTLEDLQANLDSWLDSYNHNRTHTDKYFFGRTPLQTFEETLS